MAHATSPAAHIPELPTPQTTQDGAAERYRTLERDAYDVIVVGAGTGGLTAAALLARHGRAVLVLDQHDVAGGNATVFHRPGYTFDVGLHYIGDCHPTGSVPRILRAAGVDDVAFNALDPDGFDTLCFPDFTFRVPEGLEALRARLHEHFPAEARGIDRYVAILRGVGALQGLGGGIAATLKALWRARLALRHARATLGDFLETCTHDQRLRAVLAAQSGDYAAPPSRAALAMHAMVMMGYLSGPRYPVGGGQVISDRLAASIERHGGKILLLAPVTRILVEGGQAVGVEFKSPYLGQRTVRAPVVISDADLKETMLTLVGPTYLKTATVQRLRDYEMAQALGVVSLGVRRDLRAAGVPKTNFWVHPSYDLESIYAEARAGRFHPAPYCFISIATLKDPDNPHLAPPGVSNMQLVTVVPAQPEAWGTNLAEVANDTYHQNPAYLQAKAAFAARLIGVAERVFPGLGQDIVYQDVSTAMTHTRFTRSTGGTSYGLALIPSQFLYKRPSHATEIPGLYLCGASTYTGHGIPGTMWSGVLAAARIAGKEVLHAVLAPTS